MKFSFLLLTFLLSFFGFINKASAAAQIGQNSFTEVCFDNRTFCAVLVIDRAKGNVFVNVYPHLGYNVPADDYGVKVQKASAANYNSLKALGLETLDLTMDQISEYYASNGVIDSLDKKIEAEYNKCVWNTLSCGTGLLTAMLTSGWGLIPAVINCKLSHIACQDALAVKAQLEQKRLNELEKIKEEEAAKKAAKEAAGGGAGGREGSRPGEARPGGFEQPTIDDGRPGRGGVIGGREDTPGGVPLGRPVFQN